MSAHSLTKQKNPEDSALSVRSLTKNFVGKKKSIVTALDNVSLNAKAGRITGLVGADGAGKTTLIRIAAGLLVPTEGTVTVLGLDATADAIQVQSRVGYMPQKFGLYQDLTVSENMNLYADLQGVPLRERKDRYRRLLEMTGLSPFTKRRAGALSGGMKQKLGLACALIKSPRMLLLDEPTVGVDPVSRRELWKIVNELVAKDGIGVLVSTAYLDEAERCDHLVLLHEGRRLVEGSPWEFTQKVKGRVATVAPPPGTRPRRVYTHLVEKNDILDATIRSGKVRVVTNGEAIRTVSESLPAGISATVDDTPPRFEDAFMAMIPPEETAPSGK